MKIFTTPTLTFRVDGDFTDCEIILTFQQGRWELNKKPDKVWLTEDQLYTKMSLTLQQSDLADVDPTKSLYIQGNFFWKNGARAASDVVKTKAGNNLLDREYGFEVGKATLGYTAGGPIRLTLENQTIDTKWVKSNTEQYWDSQKGLKTEGGVIYVYSDRDDEKSVLDGKHSPSFKIGDGNSYLDDLPFFSQERQGVFYHTDAEWEELSKNQSEKGSIYIYADHTVDGDQIIPGIKIGDGNSYINDLPFAFDSKSIVENAKKLDELSRKVGDLEAKYNEQAEKIEEQGEKIEQVTQTVDQHIANKNVHVTDDERAFWNSKVTAVIKGGTLLLTKDKVSEEGETE